jgi:hypothetical protein
MKPSACCIVVVLACISPAISAQVRNNSAQTESTSDSVPKAPTYTPEQLFGTSVSSPASANPNPGPSPANTPQTPARPNAFSVEPDGPRGGSCAGDAQPPANDPQFPGVSASQFQRAGVSADAFTRPGVSAEQLSVLTPGGGPRQCQSPREVVLYPEPARQPRPIPSPTVEP